MRCFFDLSNIFCVFYVTETLFICLDFNRKGSVAYREMYLQITLLTYTILWWDNIYLTKNMLI